MVFWLPFWLAGALVVGGVVGAGVGFAAGYYYAPRGYPYPMPGYAAYYGTPSMYPGQVYYPAYW